MGGGIGVYFGVHAMDLSRGREAPERCSSHLGAIRADRFLWRGRGGERRVSDGWVGGQWVRDVAATNQPCKVFARGVEDWVRGGARVGR